MPRKKPKRFFPPLPVTNAASNNSNVNRSLRFETLEEKRLLTTLLVNFNRPSQAFRLDEAVAADFALVDSGVDLATPVNLLDRNGGTNLAGTDGLEFDVAISNAVDFTTGQGPFREVPILDSYLIANNGLATVTVSSLEEFADGSQITLTLYGAGDTPTEDSLFTLRYNGTEIGSGEADSSSGYENSFITFTFTKVAGTDSIEIDFDAATDGAELGILNGFSLTTESSDDVPPPPPEPMAQAASILVNFHRPSQSFRLDEATAEDFAVVDSQVDLAAPVVLVDRNGGTNLAGSTGVEFDLTVSSAVDFTTGQGIFRDQPILDSYLFANNGLATVTVSSLEEFTAGSQITLSLFGAGDNSSGDSQFTVFYNGAEIGTGETDQASGFDNTFLTFAFTKVEGVDSLDIEFDAASDGATIGVFNGFSLTSDTQVDPPDDPVDPADDPVDPPVGQSEATLLVNFNRTSQSFRLDEATATEFAVFDPQVDLTAPVNVLDRQGGTNLLGSNGIDFDVTVENAIDFTSGQGIFRNEPILDSYLFTNGGTATVTVSGLEEISAGSQATLTLYGTGDSTNQESRFTLRYDDEVVATGDTDHDSGIETTLIPFTFTKIEGVDSFEIDFTSPGNGSNIAPFNGFSLTAAPAAVPIRINAGGGSHVDAAGNVFLADQFFSFTTGNTTAVADDIFIVGTGGTTANDQDVDDILYQTQRFGSILDYEVPVLNGFYTVRLHFAETFFDAVGERIFDVTGEGQLILDDLDIFEARQNAFTPGNFSSLVLDSGVIEVTDGAFSLNFDATGPDSANNATIAAIEILPVDAPQVIITPSGEDTTVVEGGATDTYTVVLATAPSENVTITLNTGSQVTASQQVLSFTPANFDQPQTVTLTAIDDEVMEGLQTISLTHTVASLDPAYDGLAAADLSVVVEDNDTVPVQFAQRTIVDDFNFPITGAFGPDGRLYVANQFGEIRAYTLDGDNNVIDEQVITIVFDQPEFNNVLGIAFDPFEDISDGSSPTIYVSRSALFVSTTEFGSRVSAISGDNFEVLTDVVTGLPVSGFDHGVNGLQFDENGDLLIAVAGNTNTGEFDGVFGSTAPESPLTSAILRAEITNPNFNGAVEYEFLTVDDPLLQAEIDARIQQVIDDAAADGVTLTADPNNQLFGNLVRVVDGVDVEVLAAGLRNPFDLVFTTDGLIFSTENGPNGIAEDELNLITEGGFFGHPSIPRSFLDPRQALENAQFDPNAPSTDEVTAPLAAIESSTNGIDEFRSEAFGGQLRGQLFAQRFNNEVFFFDRDATGMDLDSVNIRTDVADGLDILLGPAGTIFGIDRNEGRITIAEPVDPTVTTATAFDILQFRAPASGGNPFVIGGVNFGLLADTTVTIGGVQATVTSVQEGRIEGILPALPPGELLDVVVTSAGDTSVIREAFLPLATSQATTPPPTSSQATVAFVTAAPGGGIIGSSTFRSDSFRIRNDSEAAQIDSVSIDLSTGFIIDFVFDPNGGAGDTVGRPFTPDSGVAATGLNSFSHFGARDDGFDGLAISFDDFDPGEEFTFSIDIDPTTVRGTRAPGPGDSASVSGLEITGATVVVSYSDGTEQTGELFAADGSNTDSQVTLQAATPNAPSIELLGVTNRSIVSSTSQTLRVSGTPGETVRVFQAESGLFLSASPFDVDPLETNRVLDVTHITATIGSAGFVDLPVTLADSQTEGGVNNFLAVVELADVTSRLSNLITVALGDLPPNAASIAASIGSSNGAAITADPSPIDFNTDANGDGRVNAADFVVQRDLLASNTLEQDPLIELQSFALATVSTDSVLASSEGERLTATAAANVDPSLLLLLAQAATEQGEPMATDLPTTGTPKNADSEHQTCAIDLAMMDDCL